MPVTLEAAENDDLQPAIGVGDQGPLQGLEVDPAVVVLPHGDHVGDRLAPLQLVRVVLVRTYEDDRSFALGDLRSKVVTIVQVCREAQVEAVDQLRDRAGRTRACEQHDVLLGVSAARFTDDAPSVLAEPRGLPARAGGLGVGVRVEGQDLVADEVLEERQGTPARRVVGVCHAPEPERAFDRHVIADHG